LWYLFRTPKYDVSHKMKCPYCNYNDSKVVDSRNVNDTIRRRRECLKCGARFTTYERLQTASLLVVKKDGRHEEFSSNKLTNGIRMACAKRPVSQETIDQMVDEIELQLRKSGSVEVPASIIGDIVMERLRQLDGIAYIRFASVYRNFTDIDDVRAEADAYVKQAPLRNSTTQLPLFADREIGLINSNTSISTKLVRKAQEKNNGSKLGQKKQHATVSKQDSQ
jgi:transcriptional repressor NrdR